MAAGRIHVVGLGPAGSGLITVETDALLRAGYPVWLRTDRHPSAVDIAATGSFDEVYETGTSFDDVYAKIVERLVERAIADDVIVYAVPGSPLVAERTVELLLLDDRVETNVHAALSFVDLAWMALGIDPMAVAATIVDGHRFASDAKGRFGPLLVTQVHSTAILDDIVLALEPAPPRSVTLLQSLGTGDETVRELAWDELDASVAPDHLTTVWIPRLDVAVGAATGRLRARGRAAAARISAHMYRRWSSKREG